MRYRPLLPRSSNARTIYGRQALRSSAASQAYQIQTMVGFAVHLFSQVEVRRDALPAMARRFITSPVSAPPTRSAPEPQWSEDALSSQITAEELQMYFGGCFVRH